MAVANARSILEGLSHTDARKVPLSAAWPGKWATALLPILVACVPL